MARDAGSEAAGPDRAADPLALEIAARLAGELGPDFEILVSVWGTGGDGTPREADLVVAHAELGFAFLEAKGGRVVVGDPHDRARPWLSVDRDDRTHVIKNPFVQARDALTAVLFQDFKKRRRPEFAGRHVHAVAGVLLPHTPSTAAPHLPGDVRALFLFEDDMGAAGMRIRDMLRPLDPATARPGEDMVLAFRDSFARLPPPRDHRPGLPAPEPVSVPAVVDRPPENRRPGVRTRLGGWPRRALAGGPLVLLLLLFAAGAAWLLSPSGERFVRGLRPAGQEPSAVAASAPPRRPLCRPYTREIRVEGDGPVLASGTACRAPDGTWRLQPGTHLGR